MNELLSIEETAKYLKVRKSTLYSWVHQRQIPHIKLGKLLRFRQDEIEKWLEGKRVKGIKY